METLTCASLCHGEWYYYRSDYKVNIDNTTRTNTSALVDEVLQKSHQIAPSLFTAKDVCSKGNVDVLSNIYEEIQTAMFPGALNMTFVKSDVLILPSTANHPLKHPLKQVLERIPAGHKVATMLLNTLNNSSSVLASIDEYSITFKEWVAYRNEACINFPLNKKRKEQQPFLHYDIYVEDDHASHLSER